MNLQMVRKRNSHVLMKIIEVYSSGKKRKRWFTANDGSKIHSWITYPPDFDSTRKYPV